MAGLQNPDESIPDTHGGIYRDGPFEVEIVSVSSLPDLCSKGNRVNSSSEVPGFAPKPLVVALPKKKGEYPVVQFHHGFSLRNSFYTQLISHIASHGFIVVAPQMYTVSGSDATFEISDAAALLSWLPTGLLPSLPSRFAHHLPCFSRVSLIGHSRGAKVVFGLVLGVLPNTLIPPGIKFSAIVGLDPVDGTGIGAQTTPPILRFSPNSLHLSIGEEMSVPTLVIGTGLGPQRRNFLFPPCAPEGVSHRAFFSDCAAPSFHLVASQQGHMDVLDDDCRGALGKLTYFVCRNGTARQPMRRFCGGAVVAFLHAVLGVVRGTERWESVMRAPQGAPVALEKPEWKGKLAISNDEILQGESHSCEASA